jgi:hypothetical protein
VELPIPINNLEAALQDYLRSPSTTPFDITTVPTEVVEQPKPTPSAQPGTKGERVAPGAGPGPATPATGGPVEETYAEKLAQVLLLYLLFYIYFLFLFFNFNFNLILIFNLVELTVILILFNFILFTLFTLFCRSPNLPPTDACSNPHSQWNLVRLRQPNMSLIA